MTRSIACPIYADRAVDPCELMRLVVACLERGFSLAHMPAVLADALARMDGAAGSL